MARQLTINIADDNTPGVCTEGYLVKWRATGSPTWDFQSMYYTMPIIINGLTDDTTYDISITRQCCNGISSTETIITYDTLPLTDEIENLVATGGSESVSLNWDDFTGADGYVVYMSQTNDINTATLIYDGATSAYNATGLNSSTTYYFWVAAYDGDQFSAYATDSATTS